MYTVYLDSLMIHDYEPCSSIKAVGKIKQAVNSIDSFTITLYPDNPGYSSALPMKSKIYVYNDSGVQVFAGRVLKPTGSMDNTGLVKRTFVCEGELGYLCDTVQGYSTANTAEFFFRSVLTAHNSQVGNDKQISLGTVAINKGNHRHTWSYITSYKAITEYVNEYGGEFRLRYDEGTRYLDYSDIGFSSASDTPIELAVNMVSVGYTVDPTKIASGVFAAGAKLHDDGTSAERLELDSVIWDNTLVAQYGKLVACETWDDITTTANLTARATSWLQEQPSEIRQFTVTAAQLYEISYGFDDFEVGMSYPIRNPLIGLDDRVRCVSKTIDINDPTQTTLTFGDRYTTIAEAIADNSNRSQQINKINSSVSAMNASIGNLKTSTSAIAEQLAALSATVSALNTRITNATSYSLTERNVGTWIDGDDLYEKTFIISPLADGTARSVSVALDIQWLKEVVESRGQLLGSGLSRPLECMPIGSDGASTVPADATSYSISRTMITVNNGTADRSADKAYITLRYTRYSSAPTVIYGFHVDPSKSDPAEAVTYLEDAVGMTPAAMGADSFSYGDWADAFFMPRPCMLKFDGTVDYYLDPDDYSKKTDGTAANIYQPEVNGNAMMEWPLIWYKFVAGSTPGEGYFYCSNEQVDSDYKCWCNINSQGQQIPHFYTAIYDAIGTSQFRSLSDKALMSSNGNGETTAQQEITRALANNTTEAVEWYTAVFSDRQLITALLILMSKTLDSQRAFGYGRVELQSTGEADKQFKESYTTGALDQAGLFYGSINDQRTAVKVFGMENWWGETWTRTAGLVGVNGKYMYKLTYGTEDGSSASGYNLTGEGYIDGGTMPATGTNIQSMVFGEFGFLPLSVNSDSNSATYWCDLFLAGNGYAFCGGGCQSELTAGSSNLDLNDSASSTFFTGSTFLSCKPILRTEG